MPKPCSIARCERPHYSRGWCHMHYHRWQRHGDPVLVKPRHRHGTGPAHPRWTGTYAGAHARVRYLRGPARAQTCACGAPARQWAYDHLDPEERRELRHGSVLRFSLDPTHYVAQCVSCHRTADAEERLCRNP